MAKIFWIILGLVFAIVALIAAIVGKSAECGIWTCAYLLSVIIEKRETE